MASPLPLNGDQDTVTAPATASPTTEMPPATGAPNGVPLPPASVHAASAGYAWFLALTVNCTCVPLGMDCDSAEHVVAVHAAPASTALETPATVTTYDSTRLPAPTSTGDHSMRRRPSSGAERRPCGGGGTTSDQTGPGASTGSDRPMPLRAWMRTCTALAWPLPSVGTVHVVAAHVVVREDLAVHRVHQRDLVAGDGRVVEPAGAERDVERAVAEAGDGGTGHRFGTVLHRDRDGAPRVATRIVGGIRDLVLQGRVDRRCVVLDVDREGGPVLARSDRHAVGQVVAEAAYVDDAQRGLRERVRRPVVRQDVDGRRAAPGDDGMVGSRLGERTGRGHHPQFDAAGGALAPVVPYRDQDRSPRRRPWSPRSPAG